MNDPLNTSVPKVENKTPESPSLPTPNPKENRGEFVHRCCGGTKIGEYSKWSDPNRIVADCLAAWSKAKVNAAAVVGKGDSEVIIAPATLEQKKEAGTPVCVQKVDQTPTYTEKQKPNLKVKAALPQEDENNEAQDNEDTESAPDLFATLLNSATTAHILHLQTGSYAQHKALNTLYSDLPDLADTLIEAYQGKYGVVREYPAQAVTTPSDALGFVQELRAYVAANRYVALKQSDSELQNITDNIVELLDSTIYKLTFLK
jgi:Family of unknown function (DUF5856)